MPAIPRAICLTVPGLDNSGPGHWQSLWEARRDDCVCAELGDWSDPQRDVWIARLDAAIRLADAPIVLVAHSLGCIAVAWWAAGATSSSLAKISAAMLVAPPDVDRADMPAPVRRFTPAPSAPLPFASILIASRDDPYADFAASRTLADAWGSRLIDAGRKGHVNAASGLGGWAEGEALLDALIAEGQCPDERR